LVARDYYAEAATEPASGVLGGLPLLETESLPTDF